MSTADVNLDTLEIRETQAPDMEPIVDMLREAHGESRYQNVEFGQVRLRTFLRGAFKDTEGKTIRGFLARVNGEPIGLVSAFLTQTMTSPHMHAATLIFYVKKEYRGTEVPGMLLDRIADWARSKNVSELAISVTMGEDYGSERSNAFFRKKGFKSAGENMYLPMK